MKVILRQVGLAEEWLKVFQKQRLNNLETVHTVGESVLLSQMQDEKGGKIKFGQLRALFLVIESIGRKQGMGGGGGMKQGAASWSVGQVVAHLKQQGHESLAKLCDVHAISGAVLLSLKDEDFGALGFESLGDIAVMKRVLKDLKQQQQQQQHSSFAQAASQRKTPESFLGDNASLVNLENLIPARPKSTNPFGATQPQLSAAHAMSTSNSSGHLNNPFLAQQALHNQSKPTISQLQSQQKQSLQTTAFPSFGQQPTATTSNRDG